MRSRALKWVIIAFSIVLFIVILIIVALQVGESQLVKIINSSSGISVSSIDIKLLHPTVIATEIYVDQPDISAQIEQASVSITMDQAIDLIFTKNRELSQVHISMLGAQITLREHNVNFNSLDAEIKGRVVLKDINNANLYSLDMLVSQFTYKQEDVDLSLSGDVGKIFFIGNIDGNTTIENLASIIKVMDILNLKITKPVFHFPTTQISSVPLLTADSSWLKDENNFKGERVEVESSTHEESLRVNHLLLQFPLIELDGKMELSSGGLFRIDVDISQLHEDVIKELEPILLLFGYKIPKAPFNFLFDYSEKDRAPIIELRPIQ